MSHSGLSEPLSDPPARDKSEPNPSSATNRSSNTDSTFVWVESGPLNSWVLVDQEQPSESHVRRMEPIYAAQEEAVRRYLARQALLSGNCVPRDSATAVDSRVTPPRGVPPSGAAPAEVSVHDAADLSPFVLVSEKPSEAPHDVAQNTAEVESPPTTASTSSPRFASAESGQLSTDSPRAIPVAAATPDDRSAQLPRPPGCECLGASAGYHRATCPYYHPRATH